MISPDGGLTARERNYHFNNYSTYVELCRGVLCYGLVWCSGGVGGWVACP